ncbi:hemolysin [Pseudoalteromonas luteoviolacea]|uniref:Hemolysin-type calcium-binding region n=1 Tax=Pseudoalteromonas luteoviolacea S4054 TaxID=1129367 RepID=A0A0F6ADT2_9GAMM|nr:hemolysin [Pseudoalteromonas luteoviolacea]AOT08366.1 hemolysin [Pseudoalteromonas luteoviolacea]AOT13282.1 hemolysin [Pseudoalteromonas luteoviolacea]AOT18195.1 hemolysin [Pseudoalteromonas luteoviolacea]KKE84313.1 hemolysin-type calcium-binding region [Pseudoalteromonas luteoviolacea S4054]KZN76082.1 hemolysin-type calcium-binding region [Pseudoalteromonas luteoviolacea S4047-1]
MLKTSLTILTLATASLPSLGVANTCQGELFGINAGRGDVGILFGLNEQNNSAYAQTLAEFSASALAYDSKDKRMYYISAPRPIEYKVDISGLTGLTEEQKAHLPIEGQRFKYLRLAYYDFNTNSHTVVDRTTQVLSMVFDPDNNALLGTDFKKLYQINKETGAATELGTLGSLKGKFRGDLVIQDGNLYLITSRSVYQIDRTTFEVNKLANHSLTAATGATLNQAGEVVVSRTLINDYGHVNRSKLYKMNPQSGNTCLLATVPVRLNDLATNTDNEVACYTTPTCETDPIPSFTLEAVKDSAFEGTQLEYQITLSDDYYQDVTIDLSITHGTTSAADVSLSESSITIASGETVGSVLINTTDDQDYEGDETFTLEATADQNVTGTASLPGTVLENDPQCIPDEYTRINYQFVSESAGYNNDWGVKVNGSYVKLLDEYGGSGSYDVLVGSSYNYVLAINGNSNQLTTNYTVYGDKQYWEDQNDNDYNDFVVRVWTTPIQKGCD